MSRRPLLPRRLASFALLAAAACAPPPRPAEHLRELPPLSASLEEETPDAPFRAVPPVPGPEPKIAPPTIDRRVLSNGVPVLIASRADAPVAVIGLVVRRGADVGAPGLASFTASMLAAGSNKRSALALAEGFGAVGADWSASADYDATIVRAEVLPGAAEEAAELVCDVLRNPSFDPAEIERERALRLDTFTHERDLAPALLDRAIDWALYPEGHPYRVPLAGTEASIDTITRRELVEFHARNLTPDRLTVVAAGAIDAPKLVAMLEHELGKWRARAARAKPPEAPPASHRPIRLVVVDRPGAPETSVAVTAIGASRATPDFAALRVTNAILGGLSSSRLNQNLREKHAFTHAASSSFDLRHGPGPFRAGADVVREHTVDAVREILAEIERLRTEPVSPDELADAKSALVRALPGRFEAAADVAASLGEIATHGLPLDDWTTRAARIQAVDAKDVQRVAAERLRADRLAVVLVGDVASFRDRLGELGLGEPVSWTPPLP